WARRPRAAARWGSSPRPPVPTPRPTPIRGR
ncbi:MAG: hypothetical protein AVDCRST_MAG54-2511, partial [uncultured Actinomycetospora sp.]